MASHLLEALERVGALRILVYIYEHEGVNVVTIARKIKISHTGLYNTLGDFLTQDY